MYTISLEDVDKGKGELVGGKAANLGEMFKANLPVPPGFAITTEAYELLIKENNLKSKIDEILNGIEPDNTKSLRDASAHIENMIINSKMPEPVMKSIQESYESLSVGEEVKTVGGAALDFVRAGRDQTFVAVRSSATAEDLADASFAGQMKTLVNVSGINNVYDAVKSCWASLFTPRAIFYRKEKNIEVTPRMGVIVQRMVDPEKSGVMFTSHPVTNDRSKVVIEASWGLGESVVSGRVTPDEYVLEKETGEVLEKKINKKLTLRRRDQATGKTVEERVSLDKVSADTLSQQEIKKLWDLARRVEDHYNGQPQDIEWCEERNRISLVQTRPVTTMDREVEQPEEQAGTPLLTGMPASPGSAHGRVRIIRDFSELDSMEQGNILVTKMTSPDMVPAMKKAAAIITDSGGKTSHAAIVSRELGIPCVVGTQTATSLLKENQEITVDATGGRIYSGEATEAVEHAPAEIPLISAATETAAHGEEAHALSGVTATEVKVNLAFPEVADKAKEADGVGLLRAEHMLTESGKHPAYLARTNPEELINVIMEGVGRVAKAFFPKPVWYRTLDARTDEFRSLEGGEEEPEESNPMLGWHGVRRSLDQPEVFKCELEALKRLHEQGLNNVAVMLPFVSSVRELRAAKETITFPIKTGIMVETPAAALEIEPLCREGIDFISIGSNDLTQLTLGVDRNNENIAKLYSETDPAMIKLMKHVIRVCKKHRVQTSICGEGPSNIPSLVETLVETGIDSVSVEMDAIQKVRDIVSRTERRMLLDKIRSGQPSPSP